MSHVHTGTRTRRHAHVHSVSRSCDDVSDAVSCEGGWCLCVRALTVLTVLVLTVLTVFVLTVLTVLLIMTVPSSVFVFLAEDASDELRLLVGQTSTAARPAAPLPPGGRRHLVGRRSRNRNRTHTADGLTDPPRSPYLPDTPPPLQ